MGRKTLQARHPVVHPGMSVMATYAMSLLPGEADSDLLRFDGKEMRYPISTIPKPLNLLTSGWTPHRSLSSVPSQDVAASQMIAKSYNPLASQVQISSNDSHLDLDQTTKLDAASAVNKKRSPNTDHIQHGLEGAGADSPKRRDFANMAADGERKPASLSLADAKKNYKESAGKGRLGDSSNESEKRMKVSVADGKAVEIVSVVQDDPSGSKSKNGNDQASTHSMSKKFSYNPAAAPFEPSPPPSDEEYCSDHSSLDSRISGYSYNPRAGSFKPVKSPLARLEAKNQETGPQPSFGQFPYNPKAAPFSAKADSIENEKSEKVSSLGSDSGIRLVGLESKTDACSLSPDEDLMSFDDGHYFLKPNEDLMSFEEDNGQTEQNHPQFSALLDYAKMRFTALAPQNCFLTRALESSLPQTQMTRPTATSPSTNDDGPEPYPSNDAAPMQSTTPTRDRLPSESQLQPPFTTDDLFAEEEQTKDGHEEDDEKEEEEDLMWF